MDQAVRDVESVDDLPLPYTAMLSRADVARTLNTTDNIVAAWITDGHLPAYRIPTGRYYVDPADLALVLDRLPRIPENVAKEVRANEAESVRLLEKTHSRRRAVLREIERIDARLSNTKAKGRWALLDELSLADLLDYLREFRTDNDDERAEKVATERGIQRVIDIQYTPGALGQRPKGVPERAKSRRLSTGVGQIDIWYWRNDEFVWFARYGGPRPKRSGGRDRGHDKAFEAIKFAGIQARYAYGKPVRASSVRLRFTVLERDGFACHYCGRKPPTVELHVDHVIPIAEGGSNEADNLVTACQDCNLGKHDRMLAE